MRSLYLCLSTIFLWGVQVGFCEEESRKELPSSIQAYQEKPAIFQDPKEAGEAAALEAASQVAGQKAAQVITEEKMLAEQKKPVLVEVLEKAAPAPPTKEEKAVLVQVLEKSAPVKRQDAAPERTGSRPKNPSLKSPALNQK